MSFRRASLLPVITSVVAILLLAAASRSGAEDAPLVELTPVGSFEVPVELTPWPAADTTLVVEQPGRVRTLDGALVLDITDRVRFEGEQGLLGAAVHPAADLLYVHYIDNEGDSVVAKFRLQPAMGTADPTSHRVVLRVAQPYDNHNGGELTFGPDDMLYLGLGDGGLANDPQRLALDLSSPLGKILRLDPLANDATPADNPFVGQDDVDERVWAFGLRNPWKFSFDPATGELFIADVGQDRYEEVNRAAATDAYTGGRGLSFGWSAYEGGERFNADQPGGDHVEPWITTDHADGNCSISGGAVYRGADIPNLDGWYVFGDYCTGVISAVDTRETAPASAIALGQVDALVAIAAGVDGELYAASATGEVLRLTPGS